VDESILDVARTIRPYLEELVGEEAAGYDQEISRLLTASLAGTNVDDELMSVLVRSDEVQSWAAQVLEDDLHRPPELQPVDELGYEPLPTPQGPPTEAEKFCCPSGDYVWWRRFVGAPMRTCPDHGALVPCDG
jgi:hypothetical protein